MSHRDKYGSYAELSEREAEGRDYRIRSLPADGSVVGILAPHGGKIEFLTSELARSIAGSEHNFYAFEGIKRNNNADLHVTSSNFDEPNALELVRSCDVVVTIHGLGSGEMRAQVGGRDDALRSRIVQNLKAAGFQCSAEAVGPFAGTDAQNICNRGRSGAGAQIEICAGLRRTLQEDKVKYGEFAAAVRAALAP